jgi:hypothetical protein
MSVPSLFRREGGSRLQPTESDLLSSDCISLLFNPTEIVVLAASPVERDVRRTSSPLPLSANYTSITGGGGSDRIRDPLCVPM